MKLLRVGFGYAPFIDAPPNAAGDNAPPPPADPVALAANLTDHEVQGLLVREAMELYGNNARLIQRHVETRQAEYYQHRARPALLTDAEKAAAEAVRLDVEAAIAEGLAAKETN